MHTQRKMVSYNIAPPLEVNKAANLIEIERFLKANITVMCWVNELHVTILKKKRQTCHCFLNFTSKVGKINSKATQLRSKKKWNLKM